MLDADSRNQIAEWTDSLAASGRSALTVAKYEAVMTEFAAWRIVAGGGTDDAAALLAADRRALERFAAMLASDRRAGLLAQGVARGLLDPRPPNARGALAPSTRKGHISALRSFYGFFLRLEEISRDPSAHLEAPRVVHRRGAILTRDELVRLLEAPGRRRCTLQVHLLALTACRLDEIRCLRWRDVDWATARLTVVGKGNRERHVPLHPLLLERLQEYRAAQRRDAETMPALAAALADPDTAYILLSRNGSLLARSAITRSLKRRAARAGIMPRAKDGSALSPHMLRRTWASLALNGWEPDGIAPEPLEVVSAALGHANLETTRTHYAFLREDRVARVFTSFLAGAA